MTREDALLILRLDEDATISDARQSLFDLLKAAQSKGTGSAIPRLQEAFRVIKETEGQNVDAAEMYIAHDGFERAPEKVIQSVMPYEEPLIRERIAALPERVSMKCSVTGHRYSVQLVFDHSTNKYHFKNPLPRTDGVPFADVKLPVVPEDLTEGTTVCVQDATELLNQVDQHFITNAVNEEIGLVNKAYSAKTSMDGAKKYDHHNDAEFGHHNACCHCGMRTYVQCSHCGNYTCSNLEQPSTDWPLQWSHITDDHSVPCPHCNKGEIEFRNPKKIAEWVAKRRAQGVLDPPYTGHAPKILETTAPRTEAKIAQRKVSNQEAIAQEKREAIAHDPVKRIGRG